MSRFAGDRAIGVYLSSLISGREATNRTTGATPFLSPGFERRVLGSHGLFVLESVAIRGPADFRVTHLRNSKSRSNESRQSISPADESHSHFDRRRRGYVVAYKRRYNRRSRPTRKGDTVIDLPAGVCQLFLALPRLRHARQLSERREDLKSRAAKCGNARDSVRAPTLVYF